MVTTNPHSNFILVKYIFSNVSVYIPYACRRRYSYVLKELHYKRNNLFMRCRQSYDLKFGKPENSPFSECLMISTDWSTKGSWLSTVCTFTRQSGEDWPMSSMGLKFLLSAFNTKFSNNNKYHIKLTRLCFVMTEFFYSSVVCSPVKQMA